MLPTEDLFIYVYVLVDDARHESPPLGITFGDPPSPATRRASPP